MIILPAIVILAEIAVIGWFVWFFAMAHAYAREGDGAPQQARDPVARTFIKAVRLAFIVGIGTLAVASLFQLA